MKKRILLLTFILGITFSSIAQEQDPWVGEWTSEAYTDVDWERSPEDDIKYTSFKKILKITKHGDTYMVRSKVIKVDDPSYVSYGLPMTIYSLEDNTMELRSYREKEPFMVNGEVDEYKDITNYYSLTNFDGVLYYHLYKYHVVIYNKYMRYEDEKDYYVPSTNSSSNLRLFNDNW